MADFNSFSGFYYVEGDNTYGKIDFAFGLREEISNYTNDATTVNYLDIINMFTEPLQLTRVDGTITQKLLVENAAFKGTPEDRSNIDMTDSRWARIFAIANYIYTQGPVNRTRDSINAVLSGSELDESVNAANFNGYIAESLGITKTASATGINKFSFNFRWDSSNLYTFTMFVNPEFFTTQFKSDSPAIYVYYNHDASIEQNEQASVFQQIFNNIGREYMNNYTSFTVPLFSTASNADTVRIHVFTKSHTIPTLPLEDESILAAIQATIRAQEPGLTSTELIDKYPTIFINESRAIWCLFNDNKSLGSLLITDPLNPGSTIFYNASPISLANINKQIAESSILAGGDSDGGGYDTYEITTIGNGRWFPIIIAGKNGALTDKIPKYLPVLDEIGSTSKEDTEARSFFQYIDVIINYILGKTTISDAVKTSMGLTETTTYVGFKMLGAHWKVYKRGFTTPADQP